MVLPNRYSLINGCIYLFQISLLVFSFFKSSAAVPLTINVKKEGAKGDGRTNDHDIFIMISKKINDRGGNVNLVIPKGNYLIGKQEFFGNNSKGSYYGESCFYFENVKNVKITCQGKVVFTYIPNLKFGSFNPQTRSKENVKVPFTNGKYIATIGCFIRIFNSSDIQINQIEANGNHTQFDYGGYWGDVGRQCMHVGIFIQNSRNVTVSSVYMHHFGLDGLEIISTQPDDSKILISNSRFEQNLRQGFSWVGGNGVTARNCQFNQNGLGPEASNPRSGIDIEPEVAECRNGYFEKCTFINNGAAGLISDFHGLHTRNIRFNNCTFQGGQGAAALWPHNGGILIENSTIVGAVTSPGGVSADLMMRINNCRFYDHLPGSGVRAVKGDLLIDAGGHQNFYQITQSVFTLKFVKLCYLESGSSDENKMPFFGANRVDFNAETYPNGDYIALFRGCILKDNQFNVNVKNIPPNGLYIIGGHTMKYLGLNTIKGENKKVGWNSPSGNKMITENK